jgi:hypothetical protein
VVCSPRHPGPPCSHQRTWADNDFFRCFSSMYQQNSCVQHSPLVRFRRALEGAAARLFRPMYAGANMGHPDIVATPQPSPVTSSGRSRVVRRWRRSRVMRRWRRRIVGCWRRLGHVGRARVIRPRRRVTRIRSLSGRFYGPRGIAAKCVRARRTRPLKTTRRSSAQNSSRPRRCSLRSGK